MHDFLLLQQLLQSTLRAPLLVHDLISVMRCFTEYQGHTLLICSAYRTQTAFARVVRGARKSDNMTSLLGRLLWISIWWRMKYAIVLSTCKALETEKCSCPMIVSPSSRLAVTSVRIAFASSAFQLISSTNLEQSSSWRYVSLHCIRNEKLNVRD